MQRALIIGGGVAGMATALAFRKVGIEPTVYEALSATEAAKGSFLMVMRNGVDALNALSAREELAAVSSPIVKVEYRDSLNRIVSAHWIGGYRDDKNCPRAMHHESLFRALKGACTRYGCRVQYEKRATGISSLNAGQRVHFDDGSFADGDFIVGADGIHSKIRSNVDPALSPPTDNGQVIVFGKSSLLGVPYCPGAFSMLYGKNGFFGYSAVNDEALWFAHVPELPDCSRQSSSAIRSWVGGVYCEDSTPASQIILQSKDIHVSRILEMTPLRNWWREDIVLLGDAAHAVSPAAAQGASMALEDAAVLGKCLRDINDRSEAFSAYEHLRRRRVEMLARFSSAQASNQVAAEGLPQATETSKEFEDPVDRDWLYNHHIEWSRPISGTA
jgi:2-polyprenyl-6-methoxyphenol hydroxylase-like FAD-dependent oxidoreductase